VFNYITIEFPTATVTPDRVSSFTLTNTRYAHEMVEIKFRDWDVQFDPIRPGTPIKCVIKSTDASRNFYGYVHHVQASVTPGRRFTSVVAIGASYKLKQAHQRVFINQTADRIIASIAEDNGFSYYTEPHLRLYPQAVQAGHTDLEFMVRLAKQCGYSLRFQNTEIYFQPLTKDYTDLRSSAPVFTLRENSDPSGSTLYSFDLKAGESTQYQDAYKSAVSIGGVDPILGTVFTTTSQSRLETLREKSQPEFFDSFATNVVAPGYSPAYYESQAADERNRFPYRAMVSVIGSPSLRADMPVYLEGLGKDYSGYWIVLEAQHHIVEETRNNFVYLTTLKVGSDSLGTASVWNDGQLVPLPAPIPVRALTPNKPNLVLRPDSMLSTFASPDALNMFTPFGDTYNRPQPSTGKLTFTAPLWKSDSGNLNVVPAETRMQPAVYERLRSRGVI